MKKFLLCLMLLALMTGSACADAKVSLVSYKCLICERYYFSFEGDELDSETLNDPDIQPKRVFQLLDRGKNLEPCSSNFKAHVFERRSAASKPLSEVIRNASRIAVVRDGPKLKNTRLSTWRCLAPDCGKGPFYTLNDDSLMLKDWEQQMDKIVSMKGGNKIPKCQSRWTWGHAFYREPSKKNQPVTSYEIATLAYDIYYVKN